MKTRLACSLVFCLISNVAFASKVFHAEVKVQTSGEFVDCEEEAEWKTVKNDDDEDVCEFSGKFTMDGTQRTIVNAGMFSLMHAPNGEVHASASGGDADYNADVTFKIPTKSGEFVFGDEPYVIEFSGGDSQGMFSAYGLVTLTQ